MAGQWRAAAGQAILEWCGLDPLMRINWAVRRVGYTRLREDSQRDGDPPNQNARPE